MATRRKVIGWLASAPLLALGGNETGASGEPEPGRITHSFLATGADTRLISAEGKVVWTYPRSTRDGWVLPNGNLLLAVSGDRGSVVEVTRDNHVVLEYRGTQNEVDTVQRLPAGSTLLTESGPKPRILEIDSKAAIVREVPLATQLDNPHMQQRMTRKLPNGNYLVPHLVEQVVKEYAPDGKVVRQFRTPNWPFTAIRLRNGNTVIGCTRGNLVIEVNANGEVVWQVSNDDLPGKPLNDCCGAQRLPNGNTVICSYGAKPNEVRLTEVNREKKIVWTYVDAAPHGIHEVHVLDSNGTGISWPPLR